MTRHYCDQCGAELMQVDERRDGSLTGMPAVWAKIGYMAVTHHREFCGYACLGAWAVAQGQRAGRAVGQPVPLVAKPSGQYLERNRD